MAKAKAPSPSDYLPANRVTDVVADRIVRVADELIQNKVSLEIASAVPAGREEEIKVLTDNVTYLEGVLSYLETTYPTIAQDVRQRANGVA